jgi:RNA polymerase sigma factor (TIGR02999 family)
LPYAARYLESDGVLARTLGYARCEVSESPSGKTGPPESRSPRVSEDAASLLPLVYNKLKALARAYMSRERGYQTLQPTALVHEAYLRLSKADRVAWAGKTHFFAVAATQMRRVLVERARAARAQKRGTGAVRITLDEGMATSSQPGPEVLALDQALRKLARRSERQSRVAELRVFSGLLFQEIAPVLRVSERTVRDDWRMARAWLARELRAPDGGP